MRRGENILLELALLWEVPFSGRRGGKVSNVSGKGGGEGVTYKRSPRIRVPVYQWTVGWVQGRWIQRHHGKGEDRFPSSQKSDTSNSSKGYPQPRTMVTTAGTGSIDTKKTPRFGSLVGVQWRSEPHSLWLRKKKRKGQVVQHGGRGAQLFQRKK